MKMSRTKQNRKLQNPDLQGEGNYTAAKEYNDATRNFAKSGKVKEAAENAAPKNPDEERSMIEAEEEGRAHAKPGLSRTLKSGRNI